CAACSASCSFCVYLSMRIVFKIMNARSPAIALGLGGLLETPASDRAKCYQLKVGEAFDTNAATTMSVCDELGSKNKSGPCVARFTQRAVPSLYHRQFNLRYRQLDAGDGARLGDGNVDQQSDLAGNGQSRGRFADAVADNGWRRGSRSVRQTQNPFDHAV